MSTPAWASGWEIAPADAISRAKKDLLEKRFPDVKSPEELEELLREIGRQAPMLKLEAFQNNGQWEIRAEKARSVGELELNLTTRQFKGALQSRLDKYLGQVDSPEMRKRLVDEVEEYMVYRGFYNTQVRLQVKETEEYNRYVFNVDEDYPCLVREVKTGFSLPSSVSFGISEGDLCDREAIEDATLKLENDLREAGYNQQKILRAEVRYDRASNSAAVYLPGSLGKRISFKIESPVLRFWDSELDDLDPAIVDPEAMANEIVRKYRSDGYDDVVVEPPVAVTIGDDELQYVFKVQPGTRYQIMNVEIEGMRHFSRDDGLKTMDLDSLIRLDSPPLNQDLIRRGIDNLKSAYNGAGYWDAQVHFPRITKDRSTGQASLVFVVDEGKQRVLEGVTVSGNTVYNEEDLREFLNVDVGEPLVWGDLISFEQKLRSNYAKMGYLYSSFKIDLVQKRDLRVVPTTVVVKVTEEKRVKFGEVSINGLVRTRPEVVHRELRFQAGDWYDPEKIEETRTALIRLGLFSSVSIIPSDSSALAESHETIPYTLVLREGKPGNISFGPGFSFDNGGRYSLETSYSNIGGMNRQVFLKGSISEERRQDGFTNKTLLGRSIGIGYIEPYIFDWPVNSTVTLNHKAETGVKRWELSRQGEIAFEHVLRRYIPGAKVGIFYGQKLTDVEAENALLLNLIETGDVRTGRVGLRYTLDRRDNPTWPTSGYHFAAENSWARYYLGGDIKYFRWNVSHSMYSSFTEKFVLAVGLQFSAFEGVERRGGIADVLPSSERLYAGGADSNRGFRRQELGPMVDYYDPDEGARERIVAGGSRLGVYKLELRYQIVPDTMAITSFIDSSNSFFTDKEFARFEDTFASNPPGNGEAPAKMSDNSAYNFEDLAKHPEYIWQRNYLSYGLAFNYLTPLGSFNLSYGIPWKRCPTSDNKCDNERGNEITNGIMGGVFHVNVGANF